MAATKKFGSWLVLDAGAKSDSEILIKGRNASDRQQNLALMPQGGHPD
jgi:hypothetical protein